MEVLTEYEKASGQKVNKEKSAVYMHHLADPVVMEKVQLVTGISRQEFPLTYLGCPIFYSKRNMSFYSDLIQKVLGRLQSWKGKLLPHGVRAILIYHVLQSMPIHLLSAVDPPDYDEGGLGFRSMFDVSKALFAKLWWNFRTKPSLWSAFMSNKYSKKINPVIVLWKEGSHVWRKILEARDLIEHQIYWKPRMGSSQFWFDNWTGLGSLYHVTPSDFYCDESILNVATIVSDNRWNGQLLRNILPADLSEYIIENIQVPSQLQELDTPYWMLETTGEFSVKSAWDYIILRGVKSNIYMYMWIKGLPYKITFMMWRSWKFKIPLDDGVKNIGFSLASRCNCCTRPPEETFGHVFLKEPIAKRTWEYFNSYAVPAIIIWELWMKRNSNKHREKVTVNRIIYQVSHTLHMLVKVRKPAIKQVPHRWPDIIRVLEKFVPALKVTQARWNLPPDNWLKCNMDGVSICNPGRSSYAFCIRDPLGDLIYAEAKEIAEGTNTFSETIAILEATRYCVAHNVFNLILGTDSLYLKNIITGTWKSPWSVTAELEEIGELLENLNVQVTHVMRESNQLADY
ncbi:hypothetical protein P3L10_027312 [Capsicum annuum]